MTKYVLMYNDNLYGGGEFTYKGGDGDIRGAKYFGTEIPSVFDNKNHAELAAVIVSLYSKPVSVVEWKEPKPEYPSTEQMIKDLLYVVNFFSIKYIEVNPYNATMGYHLSFSNRYGDYDFTFDNLERCLQVAWKNHIWNRKND